jgi:hypothetical protein
VKAITFAGISVRMRSRILAQVIENLCILCNSAGTLGQAQKFIELPLNESSWYMVCSERSPKLIPSDNMFGGLHRMKLIPPKTGIASELLGCEEHLVLL